jgi:hypothetical protein
MRVRPFVVSAVVLLAAAACSAPVDGNGGAAPPAQPSEPEGSAPVIDWPKTADGDPVDASADDFDREAFAAFLAKAPTAEEFQAAYPDVTLVLPGGIATMDFRSDHSRFFATVDDAGHVIGGRFQ